MKPLKKNLSIFILNYDWRDLFRNSFNELLRKFERDRLGANRNSFFVFSWSHFSYSQTRDNFSTIHRRTYFRKFKPLMDLLTFFMVPCYLILRNKTKNDVWFCYDFGFVPTLWCLKKIYGGVLVMCLNNQPRIYSSTRTFGSMKYLYSWFLEKSFSSLVDHFMTINDTMEKYLIDLGVDRSVISIFSMNTIETDQVYILNTEKNFIRKKYNLSDNTKILLSVGRLESEKNHFRTLELFSKLEKDYILVILGDGSLLDELKSYSKKLNISHRVFFPGFVDRSQLWNYYADAYAFILLSKAEALGMVFWEAMYMKIPVVGSDIPGIRETIGSDGERGRLWSEKLGVGGFEIIIKSLQSQPEMISRAFDFVRNKITNNKSINDIVI